jgi:hypothetical protein
MQTEDMRIEEYTNKRYADRGIYKQEICGLRNIQTRDMRIGDREIGD